MESTVIRVENLSKSFGKLTVLRDVSLHIKKGECVAIIGPSGTGKSVFLSCLNGLMTPDCGKIFIDGDDICDRHTNINKVRSKMGMVYQAFHLFSHLTVMENITLAPRKLLRLSAAEAQTKAEKLLDMVALREKANAMPGELSGGQQQRIAIARSVLNEPEVIIADEPTGNLDSETADGIMQLLTGINRDKGTAIVMVTHNRSIFEQYPGRIMVCKDEECHEADCTAPVELDFTV